MRKNVVTDLLFNINFSDPNLSEEDIVNDPLTQRLLDGEIDEGDDTHASTTALEQELEDHPEAAYTGPVRVALYVGSGTTTNARNNIPKVLEECSNGGIKVSTAKCSSIHTHDFKVLMSCLGVSYRRCEFEQRWAKTT